MMLWLDPLLTMVWFTNSTSTNNISLPSNPQLSPSTSFLRVHVLSY